MGLLSKCPLCGEDQLSVDLDKHLTEAHSVEWKEPEKAILFPPKGAAKGGAVVTGSLFSAFAVAEEGPPTPKKKKAPPKKKAAKKKAIKINPAEPFTSEELGIIAYLANYERDWLRLHRKGADDERAAQVESIFAKVQYQLGEAATQEAVVKEQTKDG